jgi:hypothetical protein
MKLTSTRAASPTRVPYTADSLRRDVERVQAAWRKYRENNTRDSVYGFLTSVFEIMTIWQADGRAKTRAQRALILEGCKQPRSIDPYSALMAVAAHPQAIDERTLAKWSRVERYSAEFKLSSTPLRKFVKKRGGINACAALFTRRMGRGVKEN